jgi:hypothetical protein
MGVYVPKRHYKFNLKLIKYNIFNKTINSYLNEMKNTSTTYFTDTTFICNKLGKDLTSNNPQIKKHKTCKISIITDDFNIPLSIRIDTGYYVTCITCLKGMCICIENTIEKRCFFIHIYCFLTIKTCASNFV